MQTPERPELTRAAPRPLHWLIGLLLASPTALLAADAQEVARTALRHAPELLGTVAALRDERDALVTWLRARPGVVAAESDANFVLFGRFADRDAVFRRLLDHGVLVRAVGPDGWLRVSPAGPTVVAVLHRLRPVWWVFRGWVVAYLLAGDSVLDSLGFGRTGTFLALVVCIGLSLAWGMRAERRTRRLPIVERGLLLLVNAWIIVLCLDGITGGSPLGYIGASSDSVESADPALSSGLSMAGEPITNLTAYDLDGKPIPGFQLFDQDGNRVVADTSAQYGPNAELVYPLPATDSHGYPVNGVFPVTYVLATEYYDENADTSALQVSRVLTVGEGAALSGLTAAVPPPVGSIVPIDQNGNPQWAEAVVPAAPTGDPSAEASPTSKPSPSPSPSPTKSAKAAKAK